MFVSPLPDPARPGKKVWDNDIVYEDGKFYAFFNTGVKSDANPTGYPDSLDIATSEDGVHWTFVARDVAAIKGAHAGYGILKVGEWWYYYPTISEGGQNVRFAVLRSKDLQNWERMGEEYDRAPDRSLYHERWDEMLIMCDEDENGKPVYYGYISSETREDVGDPGAGMLKSYDGLNWEVLPPVRVEWGETPAQHMELCFVEKLGGRYYLCLSGRMYMDSFGYCPYIFVGDSPYGPFTPDREAFRLCGTDRREVTWLTHTAHTPDGLLAALWLSHTSRPDIPSDTFSIGSLKKLILDRGHLRFAYWLGTDACKGPASPVNTFTPLYPEGASLTDGRITANRDGVVAALGASFDLGKGFVLEGKLRVRESRTHIASHHHAASAGFLFEQTEGAGRAILAETLGVTRTGILRYGQEKITDFEPYEHAGYGLATGRSGQLSGTFSFECEDTVGPYGHASYCGIRHGVQHTFRLLARGDYFELYIDDLYVQTFLTPKQFTGRLCVCVFDGTAEFADIMVWAMDI